MCINSVDHVKECTKLFLRITVYENELLNRVIVIELFIFQLNNNLYISEVDCKILTIKYGVHIIYSFFTGAHKIIWLQYYIGEIIAGSMLFTEVCGVWELFANYLVYGNYIDHVQDYTKELKYISGSWSIFLKENFQLCYTFPN